MLYKENKPPNTAACDRDMHIKKWYAFFMLKNCIWHFKVHILQFFIISSCHFIKANLS